MFPLAVRDLFDPRGRINRAGLLYVAVILLALEMCAAFAVLGAGISPLGPVALTLKALFFWLATAAVIKRLHDLDHSGWVLLKATVALLVWSVVQTLVLMVIMGNEAMQVGGFGYWMSVGGTVTPVLVMILWLHVARGVPGPNRFGPEPPTFQVWHSDAARSTGEGKVETVPST